MLRILLIDDSKAVHAFVKTCFKEGEAELKHTFNGQEGLDWLAKDASFDLVLLDWEMPVLNGPDTLARIKAAGHKFPVVMMTTRNDPNDILKMLGAGVSEYILKPFTQDILREKLESILGKAIQNAA